MMIKNGDRIKTSFCEGIVTETIQGRTRPGWQDKLYYVLKVTAPRLYWERRRQIIRIDEVKEIL